MSPAPSAPPPSRRALVVRGGWEGHSPVEISDSFLPYLRSQGFGVRTAEDLDVYADTDELAVTDLVVQCWSRGELRPEQCAGLLTAVRAGTGLAGWHGGICDAFRESTDYHLLTGGQFVLHPPEFLDHTVDLVPERSEHPVVAGLPPRLHVHTEQYYVHTDPSVVTLATTTFDARAGVDPAIAGVTCPAVWTRSWGAGRVFVSTLGHKPDDFDVPAVRSLTERGMSWASR